MPFAGDPSLRSGRRGELQKIFIFRFQWDKKPQTITIGEYRSVGLGNARDIALAYRNMVNNGVDPRVKNVEAEQTTITFGFVAEQWFQNYKSSWKDFARNRHEKSISRDMSLIVNKPIEQITKADLCN